MASGKPAGLACRERSRKVDRRLGFMKRVQALSLVLFLSLPGCLDSVVGAQHAETHLGCCAIDGSYDVGPLDVSTGEAGVEEAGAREALDTGDPIDLGANLDQQVGEAQPAPLDATNDLRLDQIAADRPDTRVGDTSDGPPDMPRDLPMDSRDVALGDTRDAATDSPSDPRDAPADPGRFDSDSAGRSDGKDTADLASGSKDAPDAPSVRLDVALGDSAPEAQTSCVDPPTLCNGTCVDLQTDQANCGRCGYDCSPRICSNARCQNCPTGQTGCNGQCTDIQVDPANCGACGQVCATGACRFGVCKASTAGHIVVIGHDFFTSNTAMDQLLGNAVLLTQSNPVQLAEYVGVASSTAVSNSHVAIADAATALARSVVRSPVITSNIIAQLTSADVFLIQSQSMATNSILMQLGQSWTKILTAFVHTGGIIVLLEGSYPTNNGTTQILSQAGLTNIAATGVVTDDTCAVMAPTDPLTIELPATYPCLQNSVNFSGDGIRVVEDLGQPVVLHVAF